MQATENIFAREGYIVLQFSFCKKRLWKSKWKHFFLLEIFFKPATIISMNRDIEFQHTWDCINLACYKCLAEKFICHLCFSYQTEQILSVFIFLKRLCQFEYVFTADITHSIGNFFQIGNLKILHSLNRFDILGSL